MCRIAVVKRPHGWEPKEWSDVPQVDGELWTEEEEIDDARANNLVCGFNLASMQNHGTVWAVMKVLVVPVVGLYSTVAVKCVMGIG